SSFQVPVSTGQIQDPVWNFRAGPGLARRKGRTLGQVASRAENSSDRSTAGAMPERTRPWRPVLAIPEARSKSFNTKKFKQILTVQSLIHESVPATPRPCGCEGSFTRTYK